MGIHCIFECCIFYCGLLYSRHLPLFFVLYFWSACDGLIFICCLFFCSAEKERDRERRMKRSTKSSDIAFILSVWILILLQTIYTHTFLLRTKNAKLKLKPEAVMSSDNVICNRDKAKTKLD